MRDPDLIVRAQRAATELERAWDRWRTLHGLGVGPPPPVSSYVGYSLEEPWGQPRVVLGIAAQEAEQLTALLERHDCAGPVYAAMTSPPGTRAERDASGRAANLGRGVRDGLGVRDPLGVRDALAVRDPLAGTDARDMRDAPVRVPWQAPAGAARREPSEPVAPEKLLGAPVPADARDMAEPGPPAGAEAELATGHELPDLREGQRVGAEPAPAAFRPMHEPGSGQDEGEQAAPAPQQPAGTGQSGGWMRVSRLPGGHALSRQKRTGGPAKRASGKQEGRDRAGLADLTAELAGWAAGELPGQASHRQATRLASRPDRPGLG